MDMLSVATLSLLSLFQVQPPPTPSTGSETDTELSEVVFRFSDVPQGMTATLVGIQRLSLPGDPAAMKVSEIQFSLNSPRLHGELRRRVENTGLYKFTLKLQTRHPRLQWSYPLGSYKLTPGAETVIYPAGIYSIDSRIHHVKIDLNFEASDMDSHYLPEILCRGFEEGEPVLLGSIPLAREGQSWILYADALPQVNSNWVDSLLHFPGRPLVSFNPSQSEHTINLGKPRDLEDRAQDQVTLNEGEYWPSHLQVGPCCCGGTVDIVPPGSGVSLGVPATPSTPTIPPTPSTPGSNTGGGN